MINNTHSVGTLHFDLETFNKKHALEIQKSVSGYGRKEIINIIQESLDKVNISNSTAIIDRLEIELGEITPDEFHKDFLRLFSKYFNEKLLDLHLEDVAVKKKETQVLPKEESELEILKHFLLSGRIPWYAESTPPNLQAVFSNLVKTKSEEFQRFVKSKLEIESFTERMVFQFPKTAIVQLLENIFEIKLEKQLQFIQHLFSEILQPGRVIYKIPYPDLLMLKVLIELLQITKGKVKSDFEANYLTILAEKLEINYAELIKLVSPYISKIKSKSFSKKLLQRTKTIDKYQTDIKQKSEGVDQEKFQPEQEEVEKPVSYFVSNAGLALLNPFLPELFRKLKLLNKNQFIDEPAVHKAIHLSQYAVFRNKVKPEYLLVLNKLICGYPLENPIPIKVKLSRREKSETTRMVSAAIKHWSALKNTSTKGFRSSFLQREGLLKQTENGWRLSIERKAYDILLDKIPWNYRIIKLPWMDKIIEVEW